MRSGFCFFQCNGVVRKTAEADREKGVTFGDVKHQHARREAAFYAASEQLCGLADTGHLFHRTVRRRQQLKLFLRADRVRPWLLQAMIKDLPRLTLS